MLAPDRRVRNYIQLGKLTIEEFETQANDQSRWTPVRVRRQEEGVEQGRPTAAAPHSHSLVCRRRPASSAAHSCNGPGAGHRPPRDSVVAAEGERGQERRGLLRQDGGDVLLHPSHGLRPDLEGADLSCGQAGPSLQLPALPETAYSCTAAPFSPAGSQAR